jgi:hypothetical protein
MYYHQSQIHITELLCALAAGYRSII